MSNTVADALTRGLDAATSTEEGAKTPQKQQQQQRQEEQQRRSLLMQPNNGTKVVLLSPGAHSMVSHSFLYFMSSLR
jgi:hypothetical protein